MKALPYLFLFLFCSAILHAQDNVDPPVPVVSDKIFQVVEQMPEYPGGDEAMMKLIQQHITYPSDAREMNLQGRVVLGFVVNEDGSLDSFAVKRGLWPSIDAEALRVVRLLKDFKPGKQQGKAVRVSFVLPIMFRVSGGELLPIINPNITDPDEAKANAACEKGNYEKALKLYKSVCSLDPSNSFAANNLGLCLYQTGDKNGACEAWKKLIDKGFHPTEYDRLKNCAPHRPAHMR